jgi:hypothetical protein
MKSFACLSVAVLMLAGCLPTPGAPGIAPADEGGVRVYGGWITGCDNENICTAIRTIDAVDGDFGGAGVPFLSIKHHPHRDAVPEIRIVDPANPAPDAVLRPQIASIQFDFSARGVSTGRMTYYARADFADGTRLNMPGSYRFKDEEARTVLYALRQGVPVLLTIGPKRIPVATAKLDDALAHFDREQDLENTPGALVLRPGNVMYDYAHPTPPDAPTVELVGFDQKEFDAWLKSYLKQHPGQKVKHEAQPEWGLITAIRYKSPDFDCGVYERWGHERGSRKFVLVERREMPVCVGIGEAHWVRTYRADTISWEP